MLREEFLEAAYSIAEEHGGSITSGLRSKLRNRVVGGHSRSRHLTGFAVDVVLDEMSAEAKRKFQDALIAAGLLGLDEGDHIHVQPVGPWGRPPG
jgi:uncharacterized protein YcbK (DUF882 family)